MANQKKFIILIRNSFFYCLACFCIIFLGFTTWGECQQIQFNKVSAPTGKNFYHITGMVQDQQGFMWLASKNGLFRHDGYQMVHYRNNPLDENSLGSDYLESICIDPSGIIWIGTFNSGLDRLDPTTGHFTHYRHNPSDPSSISSNVVQVVFADRSGTLWIGTNGLDRFNAATNNFTHFRYNPNDPGSISSDVIRTIYEDRQGKLWIGTGSVYGQDGNNPLTGGLNRMNKSKGSFSRYLHEPNNPQSLVNNKVRAVFEDSKGNFWVGTAGDGLHIMNRTTGSFQRYPYDPKNPSKLSRPPVKKAPYYDHISFITEDGKGGIWIGTAESGVNYYNPKNRLITHFESGKDTAGSFYDYSAWATYRSREGVLWISSTHGSLYTVTQVNKSIPFYPDYSNGERTAVYEAADRSLWVGRDPGGLIHQDESGNLLKKYNHNPADPGSISSNNISCISTDSEGTLWVGTYNNGLNRFNKDKETFTRFIADSNYSTNICNNTILTIYDDREKYLWIGTLRGLSRFDKKNGHFRNYIFYPGDQNEMNRNVIPSILKDGQSRWWVASWNGGGIHQLDPETGKSKVYLYGASILCLYEDHTGTLWAAGKEGLYRFNPERDLFQQFEDPAFQSEVSEIHNLVEDDNGTIWMTSRAGILRLNRERNETTLFGKSYGINGDDFFLISGYKGQDGKLYFGYKAGYYAFFPDEIARGMRPPEILISGFRVANQEITLGDGEILKEPLSNTNRIVLNHNQNVFSFEFAGIDYNNPQTNRHLYMLENYDEGWTFAGSERKAIYFNVPPGKYVFRVKVVNSYGVWSTRNIEVIITPPWWTTWWFRIGAILLIAGIFYLVIRWKIRQNFDRQLERSAKDKQLAELRQKTGELEMQALRAQMNPHFVFNSLNAINGFILQNNRTQASEYLVKFSRLVRMILQNSQSTLITLESELESLKLYLDLEALRFDNRFDYNVSVSKDLDIEILKVPPLIIQPYAENAIWHGLMHKEQKGHLWIEIFQEDQQLLIRIKDDGVGRGQSATMTSKSATKHKSMGLKITADRIANLQRSSVEGSPVVINDLMNADGTSAGTEVVIKIPVIYD